MCMCVYLISQMLDKEKRNKVSVDKVVIKKVGKMDFRYWNAFERVETYFFVFV